MNKIAIIYVLIVSFFQSFFIWIAGRWSVPAMIEKYIYKVPFKNEWAQQVNNAFFIPRTLFLIVSSLIFLCIFNAFFKGL